MTTIRRKLPNSNIGRFTAINAAQFRQDNLPPGTIILNPATVTRLADMKTNYNSGYVNIAQASGALNNHTPTKDAAINTMRLLDNHFIQVFNLGVTRGKYNAGDRTYYHLEVSNDNLPDLSTEAQVMTWAANLISGDALRIGAGGAPMANPDIAEVQAQLNATTPLLAAQQNLRYALDTAQEELAAQNPEADKLIKRVWDEVEAYFGEESAESKRNNARQWGVVYVSESTNILTGLVKKGGGAVVPGVGVLLLQSGAEAIANEEGRYEINTSVVGQVQIKGTFPPNLEGLINFDIPETAEGQTFELPDIMLA